MTAPALRIAVLGAGPWGRNLVRVFGATGRARVTAICDSNPSRLADLDVGASVRVVRDAKALIASPDVDAVVVATSSETHARLALEALAAGHHVFVEKPMALSSADSAHLAERARDHARILMVGHILLYHPAATRLVDAVRASELGEVVRVHSRRLCASNRERSEGPWWTLAPHDVSLMRALFDAEPTSVAARRYSTPRAAERIGAVLSFPGGRAGTIEVGLRGPIDVRSVLVVGTRRSALFDDRAVGSKLTLFDTPRGSELAGDPFRWRRTSETALDHAPDEPLLVEASRFVDAVLDGRPVPSDGPEGHAVTVVLEAGAAALSAPDVSIDVGRTGPARSMDPERVAHGLRSFPFEAFL